MYFNVCYVTCFLHTSHYQYIHASANAKYRKGVMMVFIPYFNEILQSDWSIAGGLFYLYL